VKVIATENPDSGAGVDPDVLAVVALGGNLPGDFGGCEALLEAALAELARRGVRIRVRSRWWRSAAWPDPSQGEYRNGVALVDAERTPQALLEVLLSVEQQFGRARGVRNAARTLDLDLIAFGRTVLESPNLILPHPRAHERRFVMGPLAEIAPAWRHPVSGETAASLAKVATIGADAAPA
jgi:2-amino-4-hydroxy-6-hydroxymethyldihydropteridine diphosphokinase